MTEPPRRLDADAYVALGPSLLEAAQAGAVGLVACVVEPAALVLGSAQPAADARPGIPVARRGTGGGAVLCDAGTLLVDLAVPAGHPLAPEDVTDAYRPVGEAVRDALRGLGVGCRTVTVEEARQLDEVRRAAARRACWAGISPYEVVLDDGRKLVGLAQRRRRGAVLHQIAVPVTTTPGTVADHLVDGDELRDALAATAMLAGSAGCGSATPAGLWDVLAAPLGRLAAG